MGKVKDKNILSELALVLGVDEKTLVLKLLTINALLLEKAKKEGVDPKEFFEGCLYVPKEVREKLGEDWKDAFKQFLKEIETASIDDPLVEGRILDKEAKRSGAAEWLEGEDYICG